jgi:ribosome-binding ATPase YchF (GTP1/OBG family)
MKIPLKSNPYCTIEPNVGVVEAPDQRQHELGSDRLNQAQSCPLSREHCPRFARGN